MANGTIRATGRSIRQVRITAFSRFRIALCTGCRVAGGRIVAFYRFCRLLACPGLACGYAITQVAVVAG